jgi:hypothetical protein
MEPSRDDTSTTGRPAADFIYHGSGRSWTAVGPCGTAGEAHGAGFAQTMAFGLLANPDAALPELAQAAAMAEVAIAPTPPAGGLRGLSVLLGPEHEASVRQH